MLFKQRILDGIAAGTVTAAFRRWKQPRVQAGSRFHTAIGMVQIDSVTLVPEKELTDADAAKAGYAALAELIKEMNSFSTEGFVYRMDVWHAGDDPREALRENDTLTAAKWENLWAKLERLDKASTAGPWTSAYLKVIHRYPGTRAAELAAELGWETDKLKLNVRKLKHLGLTIDLGTGYRISPRGVAVMEMLGL